MRKTGFTLLELLVVIAILATVGGGLIVAYDGLDEKAAQGQATFNIAALDNNLRTFKTLNQGFGGGNFDSLLVANTTGTDSVGASFTGTSNQAINSMPPKLVGKLGAFPLPQEGIDALAAIGVTELRYVGSSLVDGDGNTGNTNPGSIPNRIFDNTTRGRGISRTLAANDHVAVVEADNVADFAGDTPADSSRLRDIAGLDQTRGHIVVAVGIGNNASLVKASGSGLEGGLSEAPLYTNVPKTEYGRFIALFHVATDTDDDGTFAAGEYLGTAQFLGVIDTKGDWYDEEFSEYTGQKS